MRQTQRGPHVRVTMRDTHVGTTLLSGSLKHSIKIRRLVIVVVGEVFGDRKKIDALFEDADPELVILAATVLDGGIEPAKPSEQVRRDREIPAQHVAVCKTMLRPTLHVERAAPPQPPVDVDESRSSREHGRIGADHQSARPILMSADMRSHERRSWDDIVIQEEQEGASREGRTTVPSGPGSLAILLDETQAERSLVRLYECGSVVGAAIGHDQHVE
jgi:hypothetical protein